MSDLTIISSIIEQCFFWTGSLISSYWGLILTCFTAFCVFRFILLPIMGGKSISGFSSDPVKGKTVQERAVEIRRVNSERGYKR